MNKGGGLHGARELLVSLFIQVPTSFSPIESMRRAYLRYDTVDMSLGR